MVDDQSVDQGLRHDVIGTWTLDSYLNTRADGSTIESFGSSAVGQAMFDRSGNFLMMVVRTDLPNFSSNSRDAGSASENSAVVRGSLAYFGTFCLDDAGKMSLAIVGATLPNWIGTTQERTATMPTRNQLVFMNVNASVGGLAAISWRRIISGT
jgi:hypothetical protein